MNPQQNTSTGQPERSPNIITRLFLKYNDVPEQSYSERAMISLRIMDLLFKTDQCKESEYQKVKDMVLFTKNNLTVSIVQLDMMVNPNDRLPYETSKYLTKEFRRFTDDTRTHTITVKYKVSDIQETLLFTMNEINKILHDVLLRNNLINYWE